MLAAAQPLFQAELAWKSRQFDLSKLVPGLKSFFGMRELFGRIKNMDLDPRKFEKREVEKGYGIICKCSVCMYVWMDGWYGMVWYGKVW